MISGCIGGIAPAVPVLDQESPYTNAGFAAGDARLLWQQEVVVGMIGQLSRIELYAACAGTTPLTINAGSLWQSDASEFFTLFTAVGEGWVAIDTTSAGLFFNAGDTFVIGVGGADSGLSLGGSNSEPQGGYPAGDIGYSWQSEYYDGPWDLAFRTYVDSENSSRVPAPAGILLIALGTGLVGWLRKRRSL
jgi:hypothetical protein